MKKYKLTKPKYFLAAILFTFIIFLIGVGVIIPNIARNMDKITKKEEKKPDPYVIALNEAFKEKDQLSLKEIFHDIDFTYAYVFTDPNLSGEVLTKRYNLDLDLTMVQGLDSDSINRIVFLDQDKKHVFTWEYSIYDLLIFVGGYFLEEDTVIVKEDHDIGPLVISFVGISQESYFAIMPEKSQEEFNKHIESLSRQDIIDQNKEVDSTQLLYGDYFFVISSEPDDKHQFLYRKKGNDTVLILYSQDGINSVSLADEDNKLYVSVNTKIDGVLTKIPVIIDISQYDRDKINLDSYLS